MSDAPNRAPKLLEQFGQPPKYPNAKDAKRRETERKREREGERKKSTRERERERELWQGPLSDHSPPVYAISVADDLGRPSSRSQQQRDDSGMRRALGFSGLGKGSQAFSSHYKFCPLAWQIWAFPFLHPYIDSCPLKGTPKKGTP